MNDRGAGPQGYALAWRSQDDKAKETPRGLGRPFERHAESKMRGQEHRKGGDRKRGETVEESSQ